MQCCFLFADSVSFPDDLDYSFQHGLLSTSLLDNTTASITLPPSQTPRPSSTATVQTTDTSSRVPDKDDLPHHCSTEDIPHRDNDNIAALYEENTQSQKGSMSKIVQTSSDTDSSHNTSNNELQVLQHSSRNRDFTENQVSSPQAVPVKKVRFLLGEGVPDSSRVSTDSEQQLPAMPPFNIPLLFLPRTKPQKSPKRQKRRRIH